MKMAPLQWSYLIGPACLTQLLLLNCDTTCVQMCTTPGFCLKSSSHPKFAYSLLVVSWDCVLCVQRDMHAALPAPRFLPPAVERDEESRQRVQRRGRRRRRPLALGALLAGGAGAAALAQERAGGQGLLLGGEGLLLCKEELLLGRCWLAQKVVYWKGW